MIDMVMPCPVRLDQQISRIHDHGLAIGSRVGSTAFDDEAQCRVGVSMGRCRFSGKDDLKSHGNRPAARLQADVAAERVGAYSNHIRGFHERRINIRPAPELGFHAVGIMSELPISAHAEIGELAIQFLESVAVIDGWLTHGLLLLCRMINTRSIPGFKADDGVYYLRPWQCKRIRTGTDFNSLRFSK